MTQDIHGKGKFTIDKNREEIKRNECYTED